MKTILLLLIQIVGFHIMVAQTTTATVYGKIDNPKSKKASICHYKNLIDYELGILDSAVLNLNGYFSMTFSCPNPIHVDFWNGNEFTKMFIEPNDSIELTLDANQFDETLKYMGKGEVINNYLANKIRILENYYDFDTLYNRNEKEFTNLIDSMHTAKLNYLSDYFSQARINNSTLNLFIEEEETDFNYEWISSKLRYPGAYSFINHLKSNLVVSDSYDDFLAQISIQNPKAIDSDSYLEFLENYIYYKVNKIFKKDSTQNIVELRDQFMENNFSGEIRDFLFARWAHYFLAMENDFGKGKLIYDKYVAISQNKKYLDLLDKALQKASVLAVGKPSPNFTFNDLNGKRVSLSDFKGKVVYLDIWASWCGPCRMEIPYAKKLVEEMKDKDLVFLSVSIDNDEEAWKKLINDKELKGVHLISKGGFNSDICKLYNVNGVPYYYIIDKEGRIAIANAKRPSFDVNKDLEALLK